MKCKVDWDVRKRECLANGKSAVKPRPERAREPVDGLGKAHGK